METPYFLHTRRCRPIYYNLGLVFINYHSIGRHHIPQENHFIHSKTALLQVAIKLLSCQDIKHLLKVNQALLQTVTIRQNRPHVPKKGYNIWVITLMKVLGALVSPNGITSHS